MNKQIVFSIVFFCGWVESVTSINFTFKTYWPGKSVKISSYTKSFLKIALPLQREILHQKMSQVGSYDIKTTCLALLQMHQQWLQYHEMRGDEIESHAGLISNIAQCVYFCGPHKKVKNVHNHAMHELIDLLQKSLQQVHVATAYKEFQATHELLDNIKSGNNDCLTKNIFEQLWEVLRRFDGLAVTEYDFVVLTHTILLLMIYQA